MVGRQAASISGTSSGRPAAFRPSWLAAGAACRFVLSRQLAGSMVFEEPQQLQRPGEGDRAAVIPVEGALEAAVAIRGAIELETHAQLPPSRCSVTYIDSEELGCGCP